MVWIGYPQSRYDCLYVRGASGRSLSVFAGYRVLEKERAQFHGVASEQGKGVSNLVWRVLFQNLRDLQRGDACSLRHSPTRFKNSAPSFENSPFTHERA